MFQIFHNKILGGGGIGLRWSKGTNSQPQEKLVLGCNVQHDDYSEHHCALCSKVVKRMNPRNSQDKEFLYLYEMMDTNSTYCVITSQYMKVKLLQRYTSNLFNVIISLTSQ